MYSGSTLTKYSGRVLGAHQKIDRLARSHLSKLLPDNSVFPDAKQILQFEGKNGPDAIKRKSPAKDEPFHFYNPFDEEDSEIISHITEHYTQLVEELKRGNTERVAFEAAWLSHAIVDGLTPAHHYPYEQKLDELRGGKGRETRSSLRGKLILPGITRRDLIRNNWKMWGPKGLFTTHGLFEMGVAAIIAPLSLREAIPVDSDINMISKIGLIEWFKRTAKEVAVLNMYERYYAHGWSQKLTLEVRNNLAPAIVKSVTLAWYVALVEAKLINNSS